jgi:hypothetical protein
MWRGVDGRELRVVVFQRVLVRDGHFRLTAQPQREFSGHAGNLAELPNTGERQANMKPGSRARLAIYVYLSVIMVMIMVMIMIVVVTIVISVVISPALLADLLQLAPPIFRLRAALTVFFDFLAQVVFRLLHLLFAVVLRLRRGYAGEQYESCHEYC